MARLAWFVAACIVGFAPPVAARCPPAGGAPLGEVASIAGEEITLADGRVVRLAGVAIPDMVAAPARARLGALLGQEARLVPRAGRPDRHGRIVADIVGRGGWAQERLVAEGLALAAPRPGEAECADALVASEAIARLGRLGVWAHGPTIEAGDHASLGAALGRFVVVEGRVIAIGRRDTATYIDFGRRWREDFAIVIPRAARASFEREGVDLDALVGLRVRARGWLDATSPPRLRLEWPSALEITTTRPAR